jgi:hypothetical protein
MATITMDLTDALVPDPTNTAAPYWQPSSILDANDLHDGIPVLVFPDGSTKIGASCRFKVPQNYVGTPVFVVRWKTAATTGDVVWDVDYNAIAVNEPGDPSAYTESLTATDSADATARDLNDASMSATAGNFAAGDTVFVTVSRDLANGSDTLADEAELVEFVFQYADA